MKLEKKQVKTQQTEWEGGLKCGLTDVLCLD